MPSTSNVWLVGAGPMAIDYVKVLNALDAQTVVIGRSPESAAALTRLTGVPVAPGGLATYLARAPRAPRCAIVAVGVEALADTTALLLEYGVRRILVEKPGALSGAQIRDLGVVAREKSATVLIAYNRRMFASTLRAQQIILEDGGVRSMHFEFTEWSHVIGGLTKAPGIMPVWLIANSSHVIDLAFYLGGSPREIASFTSGSLEWHPSAAVFSGAGRTDRGAVFSYQADWDAPGRWAVEIATRSSRLIFRPMEALQRVRKGSVAIEAVDLDDRLDREFKPGLHEQVRRFLANDDAGFCSLDQQVANWAIYARMANYPAS